MKSWREIVATRDIVDSMALVLKLPVPGKRLLGINASKSAAIYVTRSWSRLLSMLASPPDNSLSETNFSALSMQLVAPHAYYFCHYLQPIVATKNWNLLADVLNLAEEAIFKTIKLVMKKSSKRETPVFFTIALSSYFWFSLLLAVKYAKASEEEDRNFFSAALHVGTLHAIHGLQLIVNHCLINKEHRPLMQPALSLKEFVDKTLRTIVRSQYDELNCLEQAIHRKDRINLRRIRRLASRNASELYKAGGARRAEKKFESELGKVFRSLGFAVVPAAVGARRVDLTCISHPTLRGGSVCFLVEAKSAAREYALPVADQRAIRDYVFQTSEFHDQKLDFILIVSSNPSTSLAQRLQTLERECKVPIRYCNASALCQLREAAESFVPGAPFRDAILSSPHIMNEDFWRAAVDYYNEVSRSRSQYTETLLKGIKL